MRALVAVGIAGLLVGAPCARADTYDYTVDRFEADGNVLGPEDGTPDVVEEFDDGVMGPVFGPTAGSVNEAGGVLHLRSPGAHVAIPGVTPVSFETSAVVSQAPPLLQFGAGDMTLRAVLPAQAIGPNDAVNFLLSSIEGSDLYYVGVSIVNFNRGLADRLHVTPGLSILSHQEAISYATGNEQLLLEQQPIDAADVTGPIVLELRYDDASHAVTAAFSLDGGATFAAPFGPLPIESDAGTASAYLAAVAYDGDCPAGLDVVSARLGALGTPGKSKLKLRAKVGGERRGYEPIRLVVSDDGTGGAVLLDVQLPDTLLSTPKCDPRDGWSGGGSYRYLNYSNALPPDCAAGSAHGLSRVQIRWNGTNDVTIKVVHGALPPIVGPLRLAVYPGTGPVNACDGFIGTANCRTGPAKAKCSSAY
jgi:hypothetical protein